MKNFLLSIPPAIYSDGSPMYQHSGEVVSKVFTGGYVGDIKQTVELNIGYLIPAKTTT